MTEVILYVGFFLCGLSGLMLRYEIRLRSSYVSALKAEGVGDTSMLPEQRIMFVTWSAVFVVGCGLVAWGSIR